MVLDGPIDGTWFRAYVEQVSPRPLKPGDIVVIDNLGSHRSPKIQTRHRSRRRQPALPADLLA